MDVRKAQMHNGWTAVHMVEGSRYHCVALVKPSEESVVLGAGGSLKEACMYAAEHAARDLAPAPTWDEIFGDIDCALVALWHPERFTKDSEGVLVLKKDHWVS